MEVLKIEKSPKKNKKYRADVIINKQLFKNIDFGQLPYAHYRDSTPLKLYSSLDHNDLKRRNSYLARHARNTGPAGILAREFLW